MRVRADFEYSHPLDKQEEHRCHNLQLLVPDQPLSQPGRDKQPWGEMNAGSPEL